ncbi:leucine-rich repeat extensin-like protein 3 isoform X1 [Cajanus cajan]|uniref:leucine-rich repeat extensin-like protein 3 isoform X1 n=2 Tax=Cajanus cajan TaxID=3821 RepID=UPI00098DA1C5|nr:leucine-rich repeat extensin-like protein 3 isoform X1 [Cajanus cajan]
MDSRAYTLRVTIAILCISVLASTLFPVCDAMNHGRGTVGHKIRRNLKKIKIKPVKRLNRYSSFWYSDFDSYGSPSSLPLPSFNSLSPQPTPSTSIAPSLPPPSIGGIGNPSLPASSPVQSPPHGVFGPPSPKSILSSPPPSPYPPSPPKHSPSPPKSVPSLSPPQVYLPPVVFPPPPSPSAHRKKPPQYTLWCVAKPTVPDPIIQEAMDYACGSGADCKSIQPNGLCFQPNTLLAHASYAFNSYWQNTKIGGGTCDFGGTAMLVTVDPSYDKCNFMLT